LHWASEALPSQIHAYQALLSFSKGKVSFVVVAAEAWAALAVKLDTAHLFERPPLQVGGAPEFAVGAPLVLQINK
jgi:hypothetical protein